jgi:sugar phosphate isomerase/epimerase
MTTTRREFIRNSALLMAGGALVSEMADAAVKQSKRITAVQLYCVRDDMKKDPLGSLTQLAKMGYTHVEHANYVNQKFYGWTAAEFKKVLDDLGLKMPSGHTVLGKNHWDAARKDFTDVWKKTVDDAAYLGQLFVVSPSMEGNVRKNYDDFMQFMEVFNQCGLLCKKSGMKFGYHNHDFEFSESFNGVKLFDLIMKHTDPDKVVMQLDMGNMYIAGAIAKKVIGQYPGRYDTIHVKDMIKTSNGEGFESTILGKGLIDSKTVTDMGKKSGTTLFVIEQESYQGKTPMECMKEDLAIMKKWGYS